MSKKKSFLYKETKKDGKQTVTLKFRTKLGNKILEPGTHEVTQEEYNALKIFINK